MTDRIKPSGEEFLTPHDLQSWLRQEIADSTKALELRLREATALVTDYSQGKINPEEATRRAQAFDWRWGEALPGTSAAAGVSDAEILEAIDKALQPTSRPVAYSNIVGRITSGKQNSR